MKTNVCLAIVLFGVLGCQPPESGGEPSNVTEQEISLPGTNASSSCIEVTQITGGDLMALADRIAVGEVRDIQFVDELRTLDGRHDPAEGECRPLLYTWTIKVSLDVSQNIKGSGDTLDLYLTPKNLLWRSLPLQKVEGQWKPELEPAIELSSTLAWTETSGVQVGQELLVFSAEDQSGASGIVFPMAQRTDDGTWAFQHQPLECDELPENLRASFELQTLETELESDATGRFDYELSRRDDLVTMVHSYCITGPDLHDPIPESDAGVR
ncbi:hypothetical protein FRD01_09365 [Microvenator marinus]|uniref:Lipoprotein n=1 Tax=Microvenator marinus TaxID=2600177 RepID=A0A5B8XPH6_9DELT|nr:hypothetical protein [Microvenator marinus]QED27444.1 hypothetical protein FRD01_09365 [Microvenator marinus]